MKPDFFQNNLNEFHRNRSIIIWPIDYIYELCFKKNFFSLSNVRIILTDDYTACSIETKAKDKSLQSYQIRRLSYRF